MFYHLQIIVAPHASFIEALTHMARQHDPDGQTCFEVVQQPYDVMLGAASDLCGGECPTNLRFLIENSVTVHTIAGDVGDSVQCIVAFDHPGLAARTYYYVEVTNV